MVRGKEEEEVKDEEEREEGEKTEGGREKPVQRDEL